MRICCVIDDLEIGGTEMGLLAIARRLPPGIEMSVVTVFAEGRLAGSFRAAGVSVTNLNATWWNLPLVCARFVRLLRREKPDAVVGLRVIARILAPVAGFVARVPCRCVRWDSLPGVEGQQWVPFERLALRWANRFGACSGAVVQAMRDSFGLPAARIEVVPSPPELPDPARLPSRAEVRQRLGLPADAPVVGTVANLSWYKDYPTLIKAAALVVREIPQAQFLLIGEGPERPKIEGMVRARGLSQSVHLLGRRADVPALLGAMDVFAISSLTEGLCVALAEAMWAGLPCAATRQGGVPELVKDGETGLLVPPRSPEALADALVRLLKDPALRRDMGEAGRRRVEQKFHPAGVASRFVRMCLRRPEPQARSPFRQGAASLPEPVRRHTFDATSEQPLVSVVIPSLDGSRGGNVQRLIDQIRGQTVNDVEVLVVIGVRPNGRARNIGVRQARGEYLICIDDDVTLGHERVFENLLKPFGERGDIGITGASQLIPEDSSRFQKRVACSLPRNFFPIQNAMVDSDMVSHMCLCMRTQFYKDVGWENEDIPGGTDPDLRHRVRQAGRRVVVVPQTWAYHPVPAAPGGLWGLCYNKGATSAQVQRRFPDFVLELDQGYRRSFAPRRGVCYRALRLAATVLRAVVTGDVIFAFARTCYAFGYLSERFKG